MEVTHVADALATPTHLESPDWQPEMTEVSPGDDSGQYVLVLRVNRTLLPTGVGPADVPAGYSAPLT